MTISDRTVAIIGTGNIGSGLAANFAAGGQDFLLADWDQQAAGKLAGARAGGQFYAADDAAAGDLVAELIRADGSSRSGPAAWTSPFALRCSATCTNTVPWAGW